jgi:hypothetical protein
MTAESRSSSWSLWRRILIEPIVAIAIGWAFYYFKKHPGAEEAVFAEAVITGLAAALIAELLGGILSLSGMATVFQSQIDGLAGEIRALGTSLSDLNNEITNGDRVIYIKRHDSKIAVIGIEEYQLNFNTENQPEPSVGGKWQNSISILKFDRIQDLLFSKSYLEHFFALRLRSVHQNRILIVNDKPRYAEAVHAFLEISQGQKISTYVYKKSEFYEMLKHLDILTQDGADLRLLQSILAGNPELNVMVDDPTGFQTWSPGRKVNRDEDYLLRYQNEQNEIIERRPGDNHLGQRIDYRHVANLFRVMHAALQPARKGRGVFDAIYLKQELPESIWSQQNLASIKPFWK